MFHRNPLPPLSRRDALRQIGAGFGSLGLASVMAQSGVLTGRAAAMSPRFAARSQSSAFRAEQQSM